jgi:hypothetical protein
MAKHIGRDVSWIGAPGLVDVASVKRCMSHDFADYFRFWKHNGWWFFDSPQVIRELAHEHGLELAGTELFYYEVHERQFAEDRAEWLPFALEPEPGFTTQVIIPTQRRLEGYDVVPFSVGTSAECSPLACCRIAREVGVNPRCLLSSFERAHELLEAGAFRNTEPGPFRIFAVYTVPW